MFKIFSKNYQLIKGEKKVFREVKNKIKKAKTIEMTKDGTIELYTLDDRCSVRFVEKNPEFKVIDNYVSVNKEIILLDCLCDDDVRVFRHKWFDFLLKKARKRYDKELKKQEKLRKKQQKDEKLTYQIKMFEIAERIKSL